MTEPMTMTTLRRRPGSAPASRQRGVMLIIALIVLVAMTMAGIGMMRSADTATVVAGNIAYKQATIAGADTGLQEAYWWLTSNSLGVVLHTTNTGVGYISSVPADEPDWSKALSWSNAKVLNSGNPDAYGNVVSFLVHRMCPVPNCAPEATCLSSVNTCGSTPNTQLVTGDGLDRSKPSFATRPPQVHYRITARAVGPRNSVTIVQTMVRIE
jgi:type IV pilus assembly protein PilX